MNTFRDVCYKCYRPVTSCMCKYIKKIDTKTRFVILMHPKEFKKTKNTSGHFVNLSLNNCEIFVGIDFSKHEKINDILNDKTNSCYVLYPSNNSINLNTNKLQNNNTNVIFIIDSTWSCAKSILYDSKNIDALEKISFTHSKKSLFKIKIQPKDYCLSTIESTLCVLELLNKSEHENISSLDGFLEPFLKMVEYQLACANDTHNIRYKEY